MLSQTGRNAKQTVCCTEEISITFLQEVIYLTKVPWGEALKAHKAFIYFFYPYTTCSDPTALLVKQTSRNCALYIWGTVWSSHIITVWIWGLVTGSKVGHFFYHLCHAPWKVLLYCACNYSSRTIFEEISAIPSLHKSGTFFNTFLHFYYVFE